MDLSIVIPLFNKRPYIERAVDSVLRQTMQPREIIVVDDGSTDNGVSRVDGRAHVIRQPNAGVSVARNNGIAACATQWVALLDADDEWKPEFLSKVSELVDRRPELVCIGTDFTDDYGEPMVGKIELRGDAIDDIFQQSLLRGFSVLSSSSVAVRRDALQAAGGFPAGCVLMEDTDTWMRLAWTGSIGFIPHGLATYYRSVPGSASKLHRHEPTLPIMVETYERWRQAGRIPAHLRDSSAKFARHWLFQFARHLIFRGRGSEARATLQRFSELCDGDPATTRRLVARSRVPQSLPLISRRIKSVLGLYRQPEFF